MAPTLGYWKLTGFGRPIRLLLKYKGVDFEDKTYNQEEWLVDKSKLAAAGLRNPNLPYWIDGDVKLTESLAIVYYLGRKYQMVGRTEEEKCLNDIAYSYNHEVRVVMGMAAYSPNFDTAKLSLIEALDGRLTKYEDMLGDKTWFISEELSIADFQIYDMVDMLCLFQPGCLKTHPNLQAFMKRFEAIPQIKSYMESDSYIKYPIYKPQAAWGNK